MSSLCSSLLSLPDDFCARVDPEAKAAAAAAAVWLKSFYRLCWVREYSLEVWTFGWKDCQTKPGHARAPDSFDSKWGVWEAKKKKNDWHQFTQPVGWSGEAVRECGRHSLPGHPSGENPKWWAGQMPSGLCSYRTLPCINNRCRKSFRCHVSHLYVREMQHDQNVNYVAGSLCIQPAIRGISTPLVTSSDTWVRHSDLQRVEPFQESGHFLTTSS